MRRFLTVTLLLVAALAAAAWSLRAQIAMQLMARGATEAMRTDLAASLPDGLHLAVCGAGSPMPDAARSGPCLAVVAGERLVIVDAGSGAARNLQRMGLRVGEVDALFITHFHSDHIDGLGELAMMRWTTGDWSAPLPVHGPAGIEAVVEGFNTAYQADFGYRTAHHGAGIAPPAAAGSRAMPFELPQTGAAEVVWERDGLTITAFRVAHSPAEPAVGYRFDYAARSLVISGDTRRSEAVLEIARGVDLLAHEALATHLLALLRDGAERAGRAQIAQILGDIPDYHTTPSEAAQVAAEAGAGELLLYHIVPPLPLPGLEAAFLRGVGDIYDGPVTVARDGMLVSLPADSDAIVHRKRF